MTRQEVVKVYRDSKKENKKEKKTLIGEKKAIYKLNKKEIKTNYKDLKHNNKKSFKEVKLEKLEKDLYKNKKAEYKETKKNQKIEYKLKKSENKKVYKTFKCEKKKIYKQNKKNILNKYLEDLDYYYLHECEKPIVNPPYRKTIDEVGNAVTHGVGSLFAIFAFVMMILKAKTTVQIISTIIYFIGMFFMFTMSCLYHSFAYGTKVKRLFRRFDYSSIYLLIGATYTPIVLCYLGGTFGLVFCLVQWAIIITGITLIAVFGPAKFRKIHIPMYVILGWSALLFLPKMIMNNLDMFWWILAGGVCYTAGIIPFALNKGPSHFIWHFFVLAGAITQWVGIYLYLF